MYKYYVINEESQSLRVFDTPYDVSVYFLGRNIFEHIVIKKSADRIVTYIPVTVDVFTIMEELDVL